MPLYTCTVKQGALSSDHKAEIAEGLTRIHCELTDAPRTFVHVFFYDSDEPISQIAEGDTDIVLFGNIRAGRTDATKEELIRQMRTCVAEISGRAFADVGMRTADVPASWVMEGGDLLPEPGEEAAWLERHNAKLAAAS